jgi:hypothetical protein
VLMNVRELLMPYFDRLQQTELSVEQRTYVDILGANLQEIVSPFVRGGACGSPLKAMTTRLPGELARKKRRP